MEFTTLLQTSGQQLELEDDAIHVWHGRLDCDANELRRFDATLSADEKARASRFRFESDRDRFISCRGMLRSLLGAYLSERAADIQFDYGSSGKPSIQNASSKLSFNLSHSGGLGVFAFALRRDLGVDLEAVRPNVPIDDIANRFFSREERIRLQALSQINRLNAFFLCWTRKEAYIKARGEGLQIPLDSFDVSLEPGEEARFLRGVPPVWNLVDISQEIGAPAALTYGGESAIRRIRFGAMTPDF